jgi:hypothetical protein
VHGALLVRMANVVVANSIAGSRPATRTEAAQKTNGLGRACICPEESAAVPERNRRPLENSG